MNQIRIGQKVKLRMDHKEVYGPRGPFEGQIVTVYGYEGKNNENIRVFYDDSWGTRIEKVLDKWDSFEVVA
jgi:hypothetical protein